MELIWLKEKAVRIYTCAGVGAIAVWGALGWMREAGSDLLMKLFKWLHAHVLEICNVIIAAAAVIGIFMALHQVRLSERQTEEQLRISQKTLDVSARAWIVCKGEKHVEIEAGKPPRIVVIFKNVGASPAIDVRSQATWIVRPVPVPNDLELPPPPTQIGSQSVLGPGEEELLLLAQDRSISTNQLAAIEIGTARLILLGEVNYQDPLSANRRTRFRFRYDPSTKSFMYDSVENSLE